MRRSRRLPVGLALILAPAHVSLAAQTPTQQLSTEVIAARAVSATVTIVTLDAAGETLGMGSGFLVRPSGVVVTNYHVMAGATSASVTLTSGERYDLVEALDTDPGADLAILKIPGYGLPVLPTSPDLPPVGAKLVAVGNPLGLSRTVSEGIVSAVRLIEGRQVLQMSAAISPGSSGGPVLNARGEVVAVATAFLKDGQNLNFAVPVRYAMGLVEAARTPVAVAQAFGDAAEFAGHDAPRSLGALTVRQIMLGRSIGKDLLITDPTTSFEPYDTIYVSIVTDGEVKSATIRARWLYEDGQTVHDGSETIAPSGPANTEFHISKPSAWPAGRYKVEISVDGSPAGSKYFEVTH